MIEHETAILGAGIGGLTTAVALARQGIACTVYEAGPADGPLGGGLMLAHNGMQVMQRLGLREAVERVGYPIQHLWMTDARLTMLRDIAFTELDAHFGLGHVAIKRANLRQLLLDALPAGTVRYGMRSEAVENAADRVTVRFTNGESLQASRLIAADGLHSSTRRTLLPACQPRFCGQAAWTGICRGPIPPELAQTIEAWGPEGSRMVLTPVGPQEIYWVAVTDAALGAIPTLAEVQALFDKHYHPRLAALIRDSDPAGNYSWQFHDLRALSPWHVGRTVFLGDAAHATTPNLGQGANQAMEDALCLAQLLARPGGDVQAIYAEYHRARRAKVRQVIDTSHQWGRVAHWRHPWARATRDALLRRLPQRMSMRLQKQLAYVPHPTGRDYWDSGLTEDWLHIEWTTDQRTDECLGVSIFAHWSRTHVEVPPMPLTDWPAGTQVNDYCYSVDEEGWTVCQWDFRLEVLPSAEQWPELLRGSMQRAIDAGALVAYCGWEWEWGDFAALYNPHRDTPSMYASLTYDGDFACPALLGQRIRRLAPETLAKLRHIVLGSLLQSPPEGGT